MLGATGAQGRIHGGQIPASGYSLAGPPMEELVQNHPGRALEEEEDFADLLALEAKGKVPGLSGNTLGARADGIESPEGAKAAFPGRFRSSRASSVVSQDESPLQKTVVHKVFQPIPAEQRASGSQQPAELSGEETAPPVHCFKCRKSGHMAYQCTESKDKARQRDYERRSNHIEIGHQFYANERIIKERMKVDQRLELRSAYARYRDEVDDINRRHLDESRVLQDGFDERKRQAFAPPC